MKHTPSNDDIRKSVDFDVNLVVSFVISYRKNHNLRTNLVGPLDSTHSLSSIIAKLTDMWVHKQNNKHRETMFYNKYSVGIYLLIDRPTRITDSSTTLQITYSQMNYATT